MSRRRIGKRKSVETLRFAKRNRVDEAPVDITDTSDDDEIQAPPLPSTGGALTVSWRADPEEGLSNWTLEIISES